MSNLVAPRLAKKASEIVHKPHLKNWATLNGYRKNVKIEHETL